MSYIHASTKEEKDSSTIMHAHPSVLLTVSYDGTDFIGFAPQKEGRTVHGTLLQALQHLDPSITHLRALSRTDAGVHARAQQVAFDSMRSIPTRGWVLGTNVYLPNDVAVRRAHYVVAGFEPRAHRVTKKYVYTILRDEVRDPQYERVSWRIAEPLCLEALREEAAMLIGTHDFKAFRSSSDERTETVRTLSSVQIIEDILRDPRLLRIEVEGTAFLHNMVRILVGTLIDVARGRLKLGAVHRAFASGDRRVLGITAPAHGLCLEEIRWHEDVHFLCP